MLKKDELANSDSCLNQAGNDEMVFVLRACDLDAPGTIRDWIERRINRGTNTRTDAKIVSAEACAAEMERQQALAMALAGPSRRKVAGYKSENRHG